MDISKIGKIKCRVFNEDNLYCLIELIEKMTNLREIQIYGMQYLDISEINKYENFLNIANRSIKLLIIYENYKESITRHNPKLDMTGTDLSSLTKFAINTAPNNFVIKIDKLIDGPFGTPLISSDYFKINDWHFASIIIALSQNEQVSLSPWFFLGVYLYDTINLLYPEYYYERQGYDM